MDQALSELSRAVRAAAADARGPARAEAICAALRTADELTATAVDLLAGRAFEDGAGLPAEMMLSLDARRTGSEARMLTRAAAILSAMPRTAEAFSRGLLAWGQVRAIVQAVGVLDAAGRASVDALVGTHAAECASADPERLLGLVDDEVARLRADLSLAREDRSTWGGFLAIQGRLDGRASFYGEGDSCSIATMTKALDAAAAPPRHPEAEGARSRASQRYDALIGICEASLSGTPAGSRPRPRLLAVVDAKDLVQAGTGAAARVLWALAGRPPRLTSLGTEVLACDAQVIPVVFDGARPGGGRCGRPHLSQGAHRAPRPGPGVPLSRMRGAGGMVRSASHHPALGGRGLAHPQPGPSVPAVPPPGAPPPLADLARRRRHHHLQLARAHLQEPRAQQAPAAGVGRATNPIRIHPITRLRGMKPRRLVCDGATGDDARPDVDVCGEVRTSPPSAVSDEGDAHGLG